MSRSRALAEVRPVPRRGLSRTEAAMYVGISAGLFDELVGSGRMPAPRMINTRKVWDVRELDAAFEDLPRSEGAGIVPAAAASDTWSDFRGSKNDDTPAPQAR